MTGEVFRRAITGTSLYLWSMNGRDFVLSREGAPLGDHLNAESLASLGEIVQDAVRVAAPETLFERVARESAEDFRTRTLDYLRSKAAELLSEASE